MSVAHSNDANCAGTTSSVSIHTQIPYSQDCEYTSKTSTHPISSTVDPH